MIFILYFIYLFMTSFQSEWNILKKNIVTVIVTNDWNEQL